MLQVGECKLVLACHHLLFKLSKVTLREQGSTCVQGFSDHLTCKCELDWVAVKSSDCRQAIPFQAALELPGLPIIWSPRPKPEKPPEAGCL